MWIETSAMFAWLAVITASHPIDLAQERPTVGSPARLSTPRWLVAEFGFDHLQESDREDMTTPALLKWTLDEHWQLRLGTVGFLGNMKNGLGEFLQKAELHTIEPGVRYHWLVSAPSGWDASIQTRIVGVDGAKQQWASTALFSGPAGALEWNLTAELSVPFHIRAKPRLGFLALGLGGPLTSSFGWDAEWKTVWQDGFPTRSFISGGVNAACDAAWNVDLGASVEAFGADRYVRIFFGTTFAITQL